MCFGVCACVWAECIKNVRLRLKKDAKNTKMLRLLKGLGESCNSACHPWTYALSEVLCKCTFLLHSRCGQCSCSCSREIHMPNKIYNGKFYDTAAAASIMKKLKDIRICCAVWQRWSAMAQLVADEHHVGLYYHWASAWWSSAAPSIHSRIPIFDTLKKAEIVANFNTTADYSPPAF